MDLEKMTLIELKALYFDTLRTREVAQRNLEAINNEINKKEQQPKEEVAIKE